MTVSYIIICFFIGSLMFSYWIGLLLKKDITKVGDGNPGAFNLWHAAGFKAGVLGIFFDFMKGYLPLALLLKHKLISDQAIAFVAIAPIIGHGFSPFMRFKGGKTIAVTFGVWSAVTKFSISLAYGVVLALLMIIARVVNKGRPTNTQTDGTMVVAGIWLMGIYMVLLKYPDYLMLLWLLNAVILTYTNKSKIIMFVKDIKKKEESHFNNLKI